MAKVRGLMGGSPGGTPNQNQPKIDITQSKPVECERCSSDLFIPGMKFRKISKLLTGTQKDAIIPIEVYVCGECGAVNEELLPDQLKGLK